MPLSSWRYLQACEHRYGLAQSVILRVFCFHTYLVSIHELHKKGRCVYVKKRVEMKICLPKLLEYMLETVLKHRPHADHGVLIMTLGTTGYDYSVGK